MHPGGANTLDGEPAPESTMSVEAAWGLASGPQDVLPHLKNRDSILQRVKEVLEEHGSPINYRQEKYPSSDKLEEYAHKLWKELPPPEDEPIHLAAELPGESLPVQGHRLHLACLSFSEESMLQVPGPDRCLKLADEILTDGFITDMEPLVLNGSARDKMGEDFVPPWGDKIGGHPTVRAFSVCHHKSAARSSTLHLLVNIFTEEIWSNLIDQVRGVFRSCSPKLFY